MAKKFTSRHAEFSPAWLQDLRTWLGGDVQLSIREVAPTVGASHVAWSYWEKGKPIRECHQKLLRLLAAGTIPLEK